MDEDKYNYEKRMILRAHYLPLLYETSTVFIIICHKLMGILFAVLFLSYDFCSLSCEQTIHIIIYNLFINYGNSKDSIGKRSM